MHADLVGGPSGFPQRGNFHMAASGSHRSQTPGAQVLNEDTATRGREMNGHHLTATSVGNAVGIPAGPSGRIGTQEFSAREVHYVDPSADSSLNPIQLIGTQQQPKQGEHLLWSSGGVGTMEWADPDQVNTQRCGQSTFGNAKSHELEV